MKASQPPRRRINWAAITAIGTVIGALAAVATVAAAILVGDGNGSEPGPVGASVEELVRATVQITAVGDNGEPVWWGSGSMIRRDGLILTAGHLVDNRLEEYDHLEVGVTEEINEAPEPKYRATVAAVDYALDIAVIKVDSDLDGNAVLVDRPFVAVGDSDKVEILDRIRVLGYPGTGGETLTATVGTVSGVASQERVEGRAFIKTDAVITGGSSGGMAVNDKGELVGIPVGFGSGSLEAELVDCRLAADTNGDGLYDEADGCLPLGGFINAVRPINLSQRLVEAAEDRVEYKSVLPPPSPEPGSVYDVSGVALEGLVFSNGLNQNGQPTEAVAILPTGSTTVCGTWDFRGMQRGMRWDAIWWRDGRRLEQGSLALQLWSDDESGSRSVCLEDEGGLPDGVYELNLSVEGAFMVSEAVEVGE